MKDWASIPAATYVMEIDPSGVRDTRKKKTVLAMQAAVLNATDSKEFRAANKRLLNIAATNSFAPTTTYEDLIFTNPLDVGPYVMSDNAAVGKAEAFFYVAHRKIENYLSECIRCLSSGQYEGGSAAVSSATEVFLCLHRTLTREYFSSFQPFFAGLNGHAGPSGLFSAAIPIIDILVHGGANISADERARILADIESGMYPTHQSASLQKLLISQNPISLPPRQSLHEISGKLNILRKLHHGSVRKFKPEAFEGPADGSRGETNVQHYLTGKHIHQKADQVGPP